MKRIALLFLLCFDLAAFGQDFFAAGIVTTRDGTPLSYVNIGIRGSRIGTISGPDGTFRLGVPDTVMNDSLTFSSVGYEVVRVPVRDFNRKKITVTLNEKVFTLPEVTVSVGKSKTRKLGITGRTPFVTTPAISYRQDDIFEQGRLIRLKEPAKVLDANIFLEGASTDSVRIRLNIYAAENGLPGSRIVEKSIVRNFAGRKGWLAFDLRAEDIYLDGDFVVSFEYLPAWEQKSDRRVHFGAKLGTGDSFVRRNSLGSWERIKGGGSVIYVTVRS
ncbi:MAG TPA: carboxypeptidase-like regulatory domain-containing protein [Sphingobacteriaceae bacterium]